MAFNKVESLDFKVDVFVIRDFDMVIRLQKHQLVLYDIDINAEVPYYTLYDHLTTVIRVMETTADLNEYDKQDTTSFFQVFESEELVHNRYLSRDLQISESPSTRMNTPLSRFMELQSTEGSEFSATASQLYCVADFSNVVDLHKLKFGVEGFFHVILENSDPSLVPTNHSEFIQKFSNNAVYCKGIVPNTEPWDIAWSSYAAMYCGYIYIENTGNYYFGLKCPKPAEIQIDDILVVYQYSNCTDSIIWDSIQLSTGFHSIKIRYVKDASETTRLYTYFKLSEGGSTIDLNVTELQNAGLNLYSMDFSSNEEIISDENFVNEPTKLSEIDPTLFHINKHLPITILTKPDSLLLSSFLQYLHQFSTPDSVQVNPSIAYGSVESMLSFDTFPYGAVGLGVDIEEGHCEESSIDLYYENPIPIDTLEIIESVGFTNKLMEDSYARRIGLTIRDVNNEHVLGRDLEELIDLENCQNIEEIHWSSTYKIFFNKIDDTQGILVRFKRKISPRFIQVSPLDCEEQESWGIITFLGTYDSDADIRFFNKQRGFLHKNDFLSSITNNILIDYYNIFSIPSVFNSKNLPFDITKGSDFIMFMLFDCGDISNIEVYGNSFLFENSLEEPVIDKSVICNVKYISISDKRFINFYDDSEKVTLLDWARIGYDRTTESIIPNDFSYFTITIDNTGGSELTDYLIDALVYNTGFGFSGTQESTPFPVCGLNTDDILVMDPETWDSNVVRMKIPTIPADSTTTVVLEQSELFSNPALELSG